MDLVESINVKDEIVQKLKKMWPSTGDKIACTYIQLGIQTSCGMVIIVHVYGAYVFLITSPHFFFGQQYINYEEYISSFTKLTTKKGVHNSRWLLTVNILC